MRDFFSHTSLIFSPRSPRISKARLPASSLSFAVMRRTVSTSPRVIFTSYFFIFLFSFSFCASIIPYASGLVKHFFLYGRDFFSPGLCRLGLAAALLGDGGEVVQQSECFPLIGESAHAFTVPKKPILDLAVVHIGRLAKLKPAAHF